MSLSRSRLVCRACNRILPRAASRCPWCKALLTHHHNQQPWLACGPRRVRVARPLLHGGDGR